MSTIKYDKEHTHSILIKLYDTKDGELIAWLESKNGEKGFVKNLLRAAMAAENADKKPE